MIARNYFWSYRSVIGPTMAGALTQWLSYAWATTVSTLTLVYNFIPTIQKTYPYVKNNFEMQLEKLARRILTFVNIFYLCVFLEAATRAFL